MHGILRANVSGPVIGNECFFLGKHYLIRIKSSQIRGMNGFHLTCKEASLEKTYKNVGYFRYMDGTSASIPLASDRILCRLTSPLLERKPFLFETVCPSEISEWNSCADFRTWKDTAWSFDGVSTEAIRVYSLRPGDSNVVFYPKYPRFSVGEIVLTDYDGKLSSMVPGREYGYARIDRVYQDMLSLGLDSVPIVAYSVRRSWKGISREDWNQFSRLSDYEECKLHNGELKTQKLSIRKLPENIQSKLRFQLFDPFYR